MMTPSDPFSKSPHQLWWAVATRVCRRSGRRTSLISVIIDGIARLVDRRKICASPCNECIQAAVNLLSIIVQYNMKTFPLSSSIWKGIEKNDYLFFPLPFRIRLSKRYNRRSLERATHIRDPCKKGSTRSPDQPVNRNCCQTSTLKILNAFEYAIDNPTFKKHAKFPGFFLLVAVEPPPPADSAP